MIFSKTCQAAIKSVTYLALKGKSDIKLSIKDVADHINENVHTVGKLLQTLVKHEIINSLKGPHGGYYITERQSKVPLLKIVEAIDGKYSFNRCALGLEKCDEKHHCEIHVEYKKIRKITERILLNKTIAELQ